MALIQQGEYRGARWAVWAMTESVDELLSFTPDELRCQAAQGIVLDKRKKEFLATRLLLDLLLGATCWVQYHDSGKPYLANSSWQISISHTDGFAAAIIHPTQSVGIDIEYISSRVLRIRDRFLSLAETEHLSELHPVTHLLLHWSAKESVFKALGESDVDFRSQLIISPFDCLAGGEFKLQEFRSGRNDWYDVYYCQNDFFVLTCTVGPEAVL
jgi:phosphopantetheinyl transferase